MQPFTLLLTLASLGALVWLGLTQTGSGPRTGPLDAGLLGLVGALVGGRAVFVVAHLHYYRGSPAEALWMWQGGLSGFGAALGAFAGLALYARITGQRFWRLADHLALPAHLPVFAAWLGCLLDGCAYGIQLTTPNWVPPSPDILGAAQPRWPTQTAGALATILSFVLLMALRRRSHFEGLLTSVALLYHGALLLGISLVRADPVPTVLGLRGDAAGGGALLAFGIGAYLLLRIRG